MRTLIPLGLLLFLASCTAVSSASRDCVDDDDCESGICTQGECEEPQDHGSVVPDTGVEDTTPSRDVDNAPDDDADTEDVDDGECRGIGCACERGIDCDSGHCISDGVGQVCTVFCIDTCPEEGWECRLLTGRGGDLVQLCVPPVETLCTPCLRDLDCGSLDNRCMEQLDGKFCATDCSADRRCPEGYACDALHENGETLWQCVPSAGICSDCLDQDGDGYGIGPACLGYDCDDHNRDVYEGAVEICDGIDNNCDGLIDEGFDLMTDLAHCGACGAVCNPANAAEFTCNEGVCEVVECAEGWADCNGDPTDGCETNILDSVNNCGACDTACELEGTLSQLCVAGTCQIGACERGLADCNEDPADGCEIDLTSDVVNCAGCGQVCEIENAAAACVASTCVVDLCEGTKRDCNADPLDGCEIDISNDLNNCGLCGFECNTENVAAGRCVSGGCVVDACETGWRDCNGRATDGCEQNIVDDVNNCGGCNVRCNAANANNVCQAGSCQMVSCQAGWVDLDNNPANGCEYQCTFVSSSDLPDNGFIDANCDGIDGVITQSIFLSVNGNDSNNGLTPDKPVATLARAVALTTTSRPNILAAAGSYSGPAITIPSGVALWGGYTTNFRSRSNARAKYTSSSSVAFVIENATSPITIDRFEVATQAQSSGGWTAAITVSNSGDNLRIYHSEVISGTGGNGVAGGPGSTGSTGSAGSAGSGSTGGAGGSNGGGNGGNGRRRAAGYAGSPGLANTGTAGSGGAGGSGGLGCGDGDPTNGANGTGGGEGSIGTAGTHAGATGTLSGVVWSPSLGGRGAVGGRGGGGGGGGAGGGEDCSPIGCDFGYCGTGRGGGGGGGGGAGGTGGYAGTSGGASIAMIVHNSTVRSNNSTFRAGEGGTGGAGGVGGAGGTGGNGGAGQPLTENTEGSGGNGGKGGKGGQGGCGGAGAGGPSVAVWGSGTASFVQGANMTLTATGGGSGGTNCVGTAPTGTTAQTRGF